MQPALLYSGAIFVLLWFASLLKVSSFWLFAIAFLFLAQMDRSRMKRIRREIQNEERRFASQSKPLSDFESASWINQALENIWPQFLQEFISKEVFKPVLPWFIDKHVPWTVKKATLQHLDFGRQPPKFRGVRTLKCLSGDDHLVLDFCLDFAAAEDMTAVLSVQMAKSVGLGITTNIHISRLQIEGKVRIGIKLSKTWPFVSRARLCFENAPYVQMTARPLSTHGLDVSELPLIAGWMERMVTDVFEQSLVEPNMLVLDVTKLASCLATSQTTNSALLACLDVHERAAIATLKLHILEAADLKPSDLNGLADPYVRGSFNRHRFKTKIKKKTLKPQWYEEFNIPIASWELPTSLVLRVRDKDQFRDDELGFCEIDIANYRGGQHHDLWIALQDIKMGRLHVTLEITENVPESSISSDEAKANDDEEEDKSLLSDKFEVINLGKGEKDGYLSIVSPGQPTRMRSWQQRESRRRRGDARNKKENLESTHTKPIASSSSESSADEDEMENTKPKRRKFWGRRSHQTSSSVSVTKDDQSSLEHGDVYLAVGPKGTTVKMRVEDTDRTDIVKGKQTPEGDTSPEANSVSETPSKRNQMKSFAKVVFKQAEKTAQNFSESFKRRGKKGLDDSTEDSFTPTAPVCETDAIVEAKIPLESSLVEKNQTGENPDGRSTKSSDGSMGTL